MTPIPPTSQPDLMKRIEKFCEVLAFRHKQRWPASPWRMYVPETNGRKFIRIVESEPDSRFGQRSVHCFIHKTTGDVLKPNGWAGPQRSRDGKGFSKYNLLDNDSFDELLAECGNYGYLYDGRKVDL